MSQSSDEEFMASICRAERLYPLSAAEDEAWLHELCRSLRVSRAPQGGLVAGLQG